MPCPNLHIHSVPKLKDATLLLALTGWMDGGLVSTGTVRSLMDGRQTEKVATIESDPFYIYNFPGSMDVASLFRPEVKYEDGLVTQFDFPENVFHADPAANLLFFVGKEPNLKWQSFADCIFDFAKTAGVKRMVFMGSFGGSVPHTREPRLYGSVSHPHLKSQLTEYNVRPSDYEGPASFATLLLRQSPEHNLEMISLAAEIPGYLEGLNPLSIEAVTRRLARILDLPLDVDKLRRISNDWESEVTDMVTKDKKLTSTVRKLEEAYDNDLISPTESED